MANGVVCRDAVLGWAGRRGRSASCTWRRAGVADSTMLTWSAATMFRQYMGFVAIKFLKVKGWFQVYADTLLLFSLGSFHKYSFECVGPHSFIQFNSFV